VEVHVVAAGAIIGVWTIATFTVFSAFSTLLISELEEFTSFNAISVNFEVQSLIAFEATVSDFGH
jgi:hypothetical protein